MAPNRKRRRQKLAAKLKAEDVVDLTDAELLERIRRAFEGPSDRSGTSPGGHKALAHLTDADVLEGLEQARAVKRREAEAVPTRREAEVAPGQREAAKPEPPPVEPHPIELDEPKPAPSSLTPRQVWEAEQAAKMRAAVAEALANGAREHESTQRLKDVGTYTGPMLGEMLRR